MLDVIYYYAVQILVVDMAVRWIFFIFDALFTWIAGK